MNTRILSFLLLATLLLCGCSTFKEADAEGGLLLVPHVNAVKIDGKQYIHLIGKKSVAIIDMTGGHVTDFYLQKRASFNIFHDRNDADAGEPRSLGVMYAGHSLKPGQTGDTNSPDTSHYWQSDAWTVGITILSDRDGAFGGFFRKTFEVNDDGSLTVRVERVGATPVPPSAVPAAESDSKANPCGVLVTRERQFDNTGKGWTEKWTMRYAAPASATTKPR